MNFIQKYSHLILLFFVIGVFAVLYPSSKTFLNIDRCVPPKDISVQIQLPILMYHYVEYVKDDNDFIRKSLNIEPHVFEAQLVSLKEGGYTFIKMNEVPRILASLKTAKENSYCNDEKPLPPTPKYVAITFDDGYEDFYTDVLPILKKHKVPATNYIVANFIGNPNYLTKAQMHELATNPLIEIGSHTLNHATLTSLSSDGVKWEVIGAKDMLEKEYGVVVESFAYPYGYHSTDIAQIVDGSGHTNAGTTEQGNTFTDSQVFLLPRLRPGILTGNSLVTYLNSAF